MDEQQINKNITNKKSQATRIKDLFTKHRKYLQTTYQTAEFKEPIMFFERRSGEVEWHENVTAGLFGYTHSEGTKRYIVLTPSKQKKFGFANKKFKGYWCHEDYPLPLPQDPYMTSEQLNIIVEKSLNDINKWRAKDYKAKGDMWWKIGLAIAAIIAAAALFVTLKPQSTPQVITIAPTAAQTAAAAPTILG